MYIDDLLSVLNEDIHKSHCQFGILAHVLNSIGILELWLRSMQIA